MQLYNKEIRVYNFGVPCIKLSEEWLCVPPLLPGVIIYLLNNELEPYFLTISEYYDMI